MHRRRNFSAQWLSFVLVCAHAGGARAQSPACPGPTSAVATEAARSAFREGQTAFNEGDYARAVELWQLAYTKDCTAHALLLNLATAQELAGRPGDAIRSLELYNERMPGSSYQEPNRRRIERLEQQLAAPSKAATSGAPAPAPTTSTPPPATTTSPTAPQSAPSAVPVVIVANGSLPPPAAPSSLEPPQRSARGDDRSLLPLGVAAVGAAASLVGGVVYVTAVTASGAAAERCGGSRASCSDADAVAEGEAARARAQTAGWITSIGAVTAVGGVIWYLAQPSQPAGSVGGWRWDARLGARAGLLTATRRF